MNPQQFAEKIRAKYPTGVASDGRAYANIPDAELTQKIIDKFPVYQSQVVMPPTVTENQQTMAAQATPLENVATGTAKGVISTVKGLGTIGQKIYDATVGKLTGASTKGTVSDIYRPTTDLGQKANEFVTPQGTAQNIGFGAEKLAEFFLPASAANKAEQTITLLSKGIKSPLLAATTRIVGKSAVQGLTSGAVSMAQTGGDIKEAGKVAATAGIIRGGLATIGEGARAIKLPERLYSTIFKNTASDMMTELKTENLVNLKQTNPEKYSQFLQQGIITEPAGGQPILNETVAKQALDAGLRGGIRNMARTVINGTLDSEAQVQNTLASYKGTVDFTEPQFAKVLKGIATEYEDVGFNEISNEATRLSKVLTQTNGQVDGTTALAIRRLLDQARIASSFDKPVSKLSLSQANFKTLADTARSRLNAIPGIGDVMKKYSFYIEAMDALAKEAARRGNNQALSLIDSLFLSSAFGGNNMIPGVTAGMARKVLMSGPGITGLGQFLNKGVVSPVLSGTIGATSKSLQNLSQPQQ